MKGEILAVGLIFAMFGAAAVLAPDFMRRLMQRNPPQNVVQGFGWMFLIIGMLVTIAGFVAALR